MTYKKKSNFKYLIVKKQYIEGNHVWEEGE